MCVLWRSIDANPSHPNPIHPIRSCGPRRAWLANSMRLAYDFLTHGPESHLLPLTPAPDPLRKPHSQESIKTTRSKPWRRRRSCRGACVRACVGSGVVGRTDTQCIYTHIHNICINPHPRRQLPGGGGDGRGAVPRAVGQIDWGGGAPAEQPGAGRGWAV